jgi:hypothetical protein
MRFLVRPFALCLLIASLTSCGPVIWQRLTLNQPITKTKSHYS